MSANIYGFSLLEIIITLVIIGVLSVIAYPTYRAHITKTHRSDGQIALLTLANRLDSYFLQNRYSYHNANLDKLFLTAKSPQGFYQLKIIDASDTTYLIAAIPLGTQASDDQQCGELFLDQTGKKSQSGTASANFCWR